MRAPREIAEDVFYAFLSVALILFLASIWIPLLLGNALQRLISRLSPDDPGVEEE